MNVTSPPEEPLRPPCLEKGATVGLVAPAGIWQEEDFSRGIRLLSEAGYRVKIPRNLGRPEGYLAADDGHRSHLLQEVWRDPEVEAILAVRGGYGSLRILPDLDYGLFREYPKIFVGFSDISALHSAILRRSGLVTFHGPVLTTLTRSDRPSLEAFFTTLGRGMVPPVRGKRLEIIRDGTARGELVGGNLTTILHLLATPYEVEWRQKIVLLEDVGEAPYRIDRMLTHLKLAGRFDGIAGLILGTFTDCGDPEPIWSRAGELLGDTPIPIWANFPCGHGEENVLLPLGIEAVMDSSSGILSFPSPCCLPR